MRVEQAVFASVAAVLSVMAAAALELLLKPCPSFIRPAKAWTLHAGVLSVMAGMLTVLLGNPWLAMGCLVMLFLILVLVNNVKVASLGEPFVFQDYEYFLDMFRYPRLFIPFFGWKNFLVSVAGGLALLFFAITGVGPLLRYDWGSAVPAGMAVMIFGVACVWAAEKRPLSVSFDALHDLRALGFVASLWRYGAASRQLPTVVSPFESSVAGPCRSLRPAWNALPHMVAVQSESFFDPRRLCTDIRPALLAHYDRLKARSRLWGPLRVPAVGANTVRTEFSFLSGIDDSLLGAHRFNPYRALARGWKVATLASFLRALGYRTICLHPYFKSFYLRDTVLPLMGFDAFWGIERFTAARRFGPYVSDISVAEMINDTLCGTSTPTFVFAITMENHGPLHLEKVGPEDERQLYKVAPPKNFEDLTAYLRHVQSADAMIGMLAAGADACGRPLELCWFGDHVPIMPKVYEALGTPRGDVEYVLWNSCQTGSATRRDVDVGQLAMIWLDNAGLLG